MNLKEIKEQAVKTALTKTIIDSANEAIGLVDKMNSQDKFNYDRTKWEQVKKFRELQAIIDEAFCELHDPKSTPTPTITLK